jgi:hypothetical protein
MPEDCPICTQVSIKRRKSIDKHLQEGKRSLSAIADHYNVDVKDLQQHFSTCIEEQTGSGIQELVRTQRNLASLIETFQADIAAGKQYEYDPESGIDGRGVINHLITAMREQRETIVALHRLRNADEIYDEIMKNVVNPLIHAMTAITIEETKRLLDEIFDLTRKTPDQHPRIKKAVDEFLGRVGDRMSDEPTNDIPEKIQAAVGRKKAPGGTPATH